MTCHCGLLGPLLLSTFFPTEIADIEARPGFLNLDANVPCLTYEAGIVRKLNNLLNLDLEVAAGFYHGVVHDLDALSG